MAQPVRVVSIGWGVKQSLLDYVKHSGGAIEVFPPAVWESDLVIYPRTAPTADDATELQFQGALRLFAHDGLMDVLLADPAIETDGSTHTLTVRTGEGDRVAIASLTAVAPDADGWASEYEARLLFAGCSLLGDVYDVHTRLDPIKIFTDA